ncbi:DNA-binding response regulator [Longimycelium tulufanense]|uniref:DNA-binding response regulator n=1 Tax=Longimycelium tulufanense TaxID=907463 RepID=A0A8J3FZK9_9PSEU|nr:response regulator transcription factor [Longimycelium tulufanense]GGM81333.1 DNA-binding response regulator [Longimycelium tulufanense]
MEVPDNEVRVVVVDRHPIVATGLRYALDNEPGLTVVGEAHDVASAMREITLTSPDVALTELDLGAEDGVELIRRLRRSWADLAVVALSDQVARVVAAVKAGARGFLRKTSTVEEIVRAIRQVASGGAPVSPSVLPMLLVEVHEPGKQARLSAREVEVLRLVASGLSNVQIARRLFVSETTVKTHLRRVFRKLEVNDRTAAVASALLSGILSQPGSGREGVVGRSPV